MVTSVVMLAWPFPLDEASACDTFDPSAISWEQFFAEPNDDDDEDDDEEDEEDDDDEDDELVVDPPELEDGVDVVVWAADLLPPQPAAATARTTIGTMAKMRLMLELPLSALGVNLLGRVAVC
jgi:hypothetical protein